MRSCDRFRRLLDRVFGPDPEKRELVVDAAASKIRAEYVQKEVVPDLRGEGEELRWKLEIAEREIERLQGLLDTSLRAGEALASERNDLKREKEGLQSQLATIADSATDLADRLKLGEAERRQLGLPAALGEAKARTLLSVGQALENDRATAAKFRSLKRRVQEIATEVDRNLDELDKVGRANIVTKTDIEKIREVRDVLRDLRGSGQTLARET